MCLTTYLKATTKRGSTALVQMAEWKDVLSSPARAPKLQLAVEQSSAGGHWNPPKKDSPREKVKKLQQDGRRHTITIKSNPILSKRAAQKLENTNTKEDLPLL